LGIVRLIAILVALTHPTSAAAQTTDSRLAAAITTIRALERPGRDSLAAAWDGNKYVQCRRMGDLTLRCEAGGSRMQPSLAGVLAPDRIARLATMGWRLDPSFGNYVQVFRPEASAQEIAAAILAALSLGYDADLQDIEIETTSVESEPCPPRNGPSQNLAGLIDDSPAMAEVSIHACAYAPNPGGPAERLAPGASVTDLVALYGKAVAAEIGRIRVNARRDVFVAFDTGIGYIQCQPETEPIRFYCEAQSADSWPALAAVLTPERVARLHAAGFADPGRGPNYSKTYSADQIDDAALADEILALLHDVYGYSGASRLEIKTEEGD
jgi:hypothetical protein